MNMTIDQAKESVIRHVKSGKLMAYDPVAHRAYLKDENTKSYEFYIFNSKREAKSALHHTIELDKAEGKFEPWNDYTMEEYEEE